MEQSEQVNGWIKVPIAARYAGVSARTVREWLKNGLPHSRVGGCVLVSYSALDEYISKFAVDESLVDGIVREVLKK